MTKTLVPQQPGFDWDHVTWGKPDSPPTAICSYCSGALPDVPLMLWTDDGHCAQFCDECVGKWWKIRREAHTGATASAEERLL